MSTLYAYTARSDEGAFVTGALQAASPDEALAHLRMRSLFVTSLVARTTTRGIAASIFSIMPVSGAARLALFRALATLVRAGVPLRRALQVTIEQCGDGRLRESLRSVASDIESGSLLSSAMARRPQEFSRLFVAMVRAGEIGGVLDDVLDRLAAMLELDRSIRKRLASSLAYPAIVACASIGLVLFLVANIVPAFSGLFTQMRVQLPETTRALLAVGSLLRSPFCTIFLVAIVPIIMAGIRLAYRSPRLAVKLDRVLFGVPVLGALLRKALIARFARTLGTLLHSGVALLTALDAARDVVESELYRRALEQLVEELGKGHTILGPLEATRLFDPIVLQLIRVGEETGTLDAMFLRVAQYFELDVETAITALSSIVEPLLIILLGAVVGTIVASVLIPLYSVIGSIK